ncbi:hypothetical protein AAA799E16_01938 [Marine Group I thaumarchaeote SCGC AAA799-E16]|uniref:Uncharacterized protein n=6 Tax=Marine Group I TaxID=905826 RepID=A0A087S5S5_9ARCH|nr:hypothetical protein AAA799N04_01815 [Marine Group I thaumarchaeote SCGC AAA799-N04]KER05421.1 hypothetical protein AAA799E16_01938 [Marine Group I thaumarchaeote SCGC AAA799-E16]KFM14783.1 hypothetical protein AAA799D11_01585 [Marine Group I thaumarchaeote SCGC AAA799-D11]KFM16295.1 hypothetical protein SCCGRSA3_02401 [Marine Group I thaumarchaeote SCGC RSA3]KFM20309.1 hypothetical protein AAA799P11_00056 [Marine Group I thaumarchaeote SCGC AAA799-P11]KFM21079.1 hypothetical protein AAA799
MKKQVRMIFFFFALLFLIPNFLPNSHAHLEQSSSGGVMEGKYFSYIGFEPKNPTPGETVKIIFSIQDENGNDIYDIETMVEIYAANMKQRIFYEPWTKQNIGDFETSFVFEESGTYQIVLSISEENNTIEHVIPPRHMLSSSLECDCTRMLFNISISENWNNIWNSLMVIIVVLPFSVFGYAMWNNYQNKKNSRQKLSRYEILRYVIMFLAFAGGLIHLSIYVDHAPLRVEYGLFLLLAAISQIGFGVLFLSILLVNSNISLNELKYSHRRNSLIYLFGLIGSAVLLGLYIYAVIYPPPLSPENHPEHIDVAGIVAKALEISLVGTIVYIMNWENKLKNKHH